VRTTEQPHGSISSTGLLFTHAGKSVGYSTDFNNLTDDMAKLFECVDLWIVDALRKHPHPSHNHLDRTLGYIERLRPRRAILTHMDNSMDYRSLLGELPPHVEPAFDGMEIEL
jgi:phosphoribosyl 1,2-cyclic phosphate phosphodiesterase